jgi:hypothetical protein
MARALRGESVVEKTYVVVTDDPPREVRIRSSARTLRDPDGRIRGAIGVFTEL